MFDSRCKKYKYTIAFFLFLIVFSGYHIFRVYGFVFYPDEFGYWSYAAKACEYDWSQITSLGSYYSYGYSLILFPILLLCKNSVIAYRVAVALNFALLGIDYFLIWKIAVKENKKKELQEYIPLFIGISLFYPPILFYAKTTMVETALMSMFLMISLLLYLYLENNKTPILLFLLVGVVYIHFLHMRAIGISIAAVMTLLLYFVFNSKKVRNIVITVIMIGVALMVGILIKEKVQSSIYANAEYININDYAGQFEKIRFIFSTEGLSNFLSGFAGKILYLGLSSFGLFYYGVAYCCKKVRNYFKEKRSDSRKLFYLYLLLAALGEILVNSIYNVRVFRVDSVVYGRYDEFVLPLFILFGSFELIEDCKTCRKVILITAIQAIFTVLVIQMVNKYQLTNMHGYVMVGMSYLDKMLPFKAATFFWSSFLLGMALTILFFFLIKTAVKKELPYMIILALLIEILLFTRAASVYIDESNRGAYRDGILAEMILEKLDENPERNIVFLKEENTDIFISSLQFQLRDKKINLLTSLEGVNPDDILILFYESMYRNKLEEKYDFSILNGRFEIYYNDLLKDE